MVLDHVKRIDEYLQGEVPPPVGLDLRFTSVEAGEEVLVRARDVMRRIASAQAQPDSWPADEVWRRRLPAWFVATFECESIEEILADPRRWDFGSWLDVMRAPGWEWWSSRAEHGGGGVRCFAYTDPFAIDPLIYLIRVAGADRVDLRSDA